MTPGDTFVRGATAYLVLAMIGQTATVVPIVSGYHHAVRGDVRLDPARCGIRFRAPAARCRARTRLDLGNETAIGRASPDEMVLIGTALRRVMEAEALERRYAGTHGFGYGEKAVV